MWVTGFKIKWCWKIRQPNDNNRKASQEPTQNICIIYWDQGCVVISVAGGHRDMGGSQRHWLSLQAWRKNQSQLLHVNSPAWHFFTAWSMPGVCLPSCYIFWERQEYQIKIFFEVDTLNTRNFGFTSANIQLEGIIFHSEDPIMLRKILFSQTYFLGLARTIP